MDGKLQTDVGELINTIETAGCDDRIYKVIPILQMLTIVDNIRNVADGIVPRYRSYHDSAHRAWAPFHSYTYQIQVGGFLKKNFKKPLQVKYYIKDVTYSYHVHPITGEPSSDFCVYIAGNTMELQDTTKVYVKYNVWTTQ